MAARKLQTEIEKTLKKVAEGVEIFESIFEKINTSTNQTQKDKLEVDLKSQIKKLQRLRDQIKTWMQSNDIKDKQPLQDNRRLIETQMERFKACEKEMKTKAFSKEGLSAAAKLDPKERLKAELSSWITTMVDELGRQVEQTEAEIETLQVLKKKKDTERGARLDELETMNDRRAWHIAKLEIILRLLENGNLGPEEVGNVKDDIAYFVESNTEEDFEEDEGIYDDLNLQEEEDVYGLHQDDVVSLPDSAPVTEDAAPSPGAPPKTPAKGGAHLPDETKSPAPIYKSGKPVAASASGPARKLTLDSTSRPSAAPSAPPPNRSTAGAPPPSGATPPAAASVKPPVSVLPPIRYAAAAAAANAPSGSLAVVSPTATVPPVAPPGFGPLASGLVAGGDNARLVSAGSSPELSKATLVEPSLVSPRLASAGGPAASLSSLASPALSAASINGHYSHSSHSLSVAPSLASASHLLPPSPAISTASLPLGAAVGSSIAGGNGVGTIGGPAPLQSTVTGEQRLPSSLADLVTSFESAKQKSIRRDNDLGGLHKILDAGFSTGPQPLDAEKPKYYVARNPFATPAYYPQEPSAQFGSAQVFAKFDIDTLFYIFYYCQGTYLQFLAAAELKKQSWRFHKQYLTWFQRANEPQQITDDYEQGVYLYFDWEGSWCQRRKSEFKFEYRYLETE